MSQSQESQQRISTVLVLAIIALFMLAMCSGCATSVPVTAKFPNPPGKGAITPCPDLQKLGTDARLSDISRTITINYTTYYECAVKTDTWIEWYNSQRAIFESAGK